MRTFSLHRTSGGLPELVLNIRRLTIKPRLNARDKLRNSLLEVTISVNIASRGALAVPSGFVTTIQSTAQGLRRGHRDEDTAILPAANGIAQGSV